MQTTPRSFRKSNVLGNIKNSKFRWQGKYIGSGSFPRIFKGKPETLIQILVLLLARAELSNAPAST